MGGCGWGSSPLTRGKRLDGGKSALRGLAHPRSRGENYRNPALIWLSRGSSPLTRGKPGWPRATGQRSGLIPAHAGKTTRAATETVRRRAHPRSRGENILRQSACAGQGGSSPLTRGKLGAVADCLSARGLIPAHAGKTRGSWLAGTATWAHPRSRGENPPRRHRSRPLRGSSPLTRGKRGQVKRSLEATGLIPAHAGKTP